MKSKFLFVLAWLSCSIAHAASPLASPLIQGKTIALPGAAGRFDFMQMDAAKDRLLAAHKGNGTLTVFDLKSGKALAEVPVGKAQGVAVDAARAQYVVGIEDGKKVVLISAKTLKSIAEIPVTGPVDALAFDSKRGLIFADEDDGDKLWVIDARKGQVVATFPIPGEPEDVAFDAATDRIYQNIKTQNTLVVIDSATLKIVAQWPTLPMTSPHGLALDSKRHRVFAAGKNGKLVGIDLRSGKVFATADIAPSADQIAIDAEKRIIYCACKGYLSVVKETAQGLVSMGDVPSPKGAHTLAIDPRTHHVWVSYADATHSYLQEFKPR